MEIGEQQAYSVLMSVYKDEKADFLKLSMDSMFNQTVPPTEFVLICDGPVTEELDSLIQNMEDLHSNLRVIRFEKNRGLGYALQIGIQACCCDIIARMDSDDISRPDRCEKELNYLTNHPEISIVGGWIEEFSISPNDIQSTRQVPETDEEIRVFAQTRNPFNHPSVMLRKADVLAAGNYQSVRYLQDYYLWVTMIIMGFKGHNLQEPLVWMRADGSLFKRRSGKLYIQIQLALFKVMLENNFISYPQYLKSCAIRICSGIAPNWLRQIVFKKYLRKA